MEEKQELYYLHNGEYVGNTMIWWRKGRAGYTSNIDDAHKFTKEDALEQNKRRKTDVPWLCSHIEETCTRVSDKMLDRSKCLIQLH